jgi:hypothetical protein
MKQQFKCRSAIRLLEREPNQNMLRSAPALPIISTVVPSKRSHSDYSHSWNFPSLDHYSYRNKRSRFNPPHSASSPQSRLCLNQDPHATEQINTATECIKEAAREAKLDPPSTSFPQINKTPTIQGEQAAHQGLLSSLVPPQPRTLYAGAASPKIPSPGVERMLDGHCRDSQGRCVDGVLSLKTKRRIFHQFYQLQLNSQKGLSVVKKLSALYSLCRRMEQICEHLRPINNSGNQGPHLFSKPILPSSPLSYGRVFPILW